MAHGNLEGHVVSATFWPSCETCAFFPACHTTPRHPAYPHRWHWAVDAAPFPDARLILRSWVGTTVFGQAHTGCTAYTVDPQQLSPLQPAHRQYLTLEAEKRQLDTALAQLERTADWTAPEPTAYTRLWQRYHAVLAEQAALRTAVPTPPAVAVNG